ncbi:MAG: hypothetical protein CME06_11340 [Gemmatimonadetes bacterium]|nr:hypothetical protein [Gemmatimonadota bacterium]
MSRLISAILGCAVGVVALEIGLRLTGLVFVELQKQRNALPTGSDGTESVRILCLGESSTAVGGKDAYPHQLEDLLNENGPAGLRFEVVNAGRPGIDSSVIVRDLRKNLDRWNPDIVTVMMGINDGMHSFVDLNQYRRKPIWRRLLLRIKVYRLGRYLAISFGALDEQARQERHLDEREKNYRRAIADRGEAMDSIVLAMLYRRQDRNDEAEEVLLELIARQPIATAHADLGQLYQDQNRLEDAERHYRAAIERFRGYQPAFRWLIRLLRYLGRDNEIEPLFDDLLAAGADARSYVEVAKHHRGDGRLEKAEAAYRKALEIERSPYACTDLGSMLLDMGRIEEAEALLRAAVAMVGAGPRSRIELARLCMRTERLDEAERLLVDAAAQAEHSSPLYVIARYSWDARPLDPYLAAVELARIYQHKGDRESARRVIDRIEPNRMTFHNYQRLVDKVMARVGRLVVIQYPVRTLAPLKAMIPEREGVVFVDNERVFKEAIAREGYNALFIDHFASDFGHTTRAGHTLIARNTARVILKELFATTLP